MIGPGPIFRWSGERQSSCPIPLVSSAVTSERKIEVFAGEGQHRLAPTQVATAVGRLPAAIRGHVHAVPQDRANLERTARARVQMHSASDGTTRLTSCTRVHRLDESSQTHQSSRPGISAPPPERGNAALQAVAQAPGSRGKTLAHEAESLCPRQRPDRETRQSLNRDFAKGWGTGI